MRRLTTGLVAFALAGSGLAATQVGADAAGATHARSPRAAAAAADPAAGYQPPPIEPTPCPGTRLAAAGATCGLLTVPLDYSNPGGTKIKIGVSEIKHKTPDSGYQGIMLGNPGGPGGSGLGLARLGSAVPNHGGDPYDWIGFDPRGVGISQPHLSCDTNYFPTNRPDYEPRNAAIRQFWRAKTRGYADACANSGAASALLGHTKTRDWVNDMESIRKAFGAQKINYYGFSYGTYLGQVYATLHPDRVRRMVWDGVVDPRGVWYQDNLAQDVAFNKSINIFFNWVAAHDSVFHLGRSGKGVRALWYQMRNKSRRAPFDGQIGPDEWTDAFLGAGYYVYGWNDTASAFAKAVNNGDYAPVESLYADANGSDDNTYANYLAVQCSDTQWPRNDRRINRDNTRINRRAPFETWANMRYNQPCSFWHARAGRPVKVRNHKQLPPILMIEETHDAATPMAGARKVRSIFKKARMIEGVGGTTHAGSLSGVSCTDDRISNYLLTGQIARRKPGRRSDVLCPPVPPDPAAASRLAPGAAGQAMPSDLRQLVTQAGSF